MGDLALLVLVITVVVFCVECIKRLDRVALALEKGVGIPPPEVRPWFQRPRK